MSGEEFFFEGKNSERMIIRRTEDVESVIENVAFERNEMRNGFTKQGQFRKIGSLPAIIIEQYLREKGIDLMDPANIKHVKKILNDMNKFRTVDKML